MAVFLGMLPGLLPGATPRYLVTDLSGLLVQQGYPHTYVHNVRINDAGQILLVVDREEPSALPRIATLLVLDGTVTDLGASPGNGGALSWDLSEGGHVAVNTGYGSGGTFIWSRGAWTDLGITGTVNAVLDADRAVGTDASGGFLWQYGGRTVLPTYDLDSTSEAIDLNIRMLIAGHSGASSARKPVYWHQGQVRLLPMPSGVTGTDVTVRALNDENTVVGQGGSHAIAWQIHPDGQVTLTQLPGLPGATSEIATTVNNLGEIGGWSYDGGPTARAVLWLEGVVYDLNTLLAESLPNGEILDWAGSINNLGQIVCAAENDQRAYLLDPDFDGNGVPDHAEPGTSRRYLPTDVSAQLESAGFPHAYVMSVMLNDGGHIGVSVDVGDGGPYATYLIRDGMITDLGPTPGDGGTIGTDLNEADQVTVNSSSGVSEAFLWDAGDWTSLGSGWAEALDDQGAVTGRWGFIWEAGALASLPVLPGGSSVWPSEMSGGPDGGVIIGTSFTFPSATFAAYWTKDGSGEWTVEPLPTLPGLGGSYYPKSIALRNGSYTVVGSRVDCAGTAAGGLCHSSAVVWTIAGGVATIEPLSRFRGRNLEALSVNQSGDVVGYASVTSNTSRAMLWAGGSSFDLNEILTAPLPPGWYLSWAEEINDRGQIICGASDADGFTRAYLLDPDSDQDGVADWMDLCPTMRDPLQRDTDGDGIGDVCDCCPSTPNPPRHAPGTPEHGTQDCSVCDESATAVAEVTAGTEATIESSDQSVSLAIEAVDLLPGTNETISVTGTTDPESLPTNVVIQAPVGEEQGAGSVLASYTMIPDGIQFANPVTLVIRLDITDQLEPVGQMTSQQAEQLRIYLEENGTFVPVANSTCRLEPQPDGRTIAVLQADLEHFSSYAVVAPLDTDRDGVFDSFGGQVDECPVDPPIATAISYTGDYLVATGADRIGECILSALLSADGGGAAAGETVRYTIRSSAGNEILSATATSGEDGLAVLGPISLEPDMYSVDVEFSGRPGCLLPSTDTAILVVYDPAEPRATGGGFFFPDAESTRPAVTSADKANFGFNVRIAKGGAAVGNLEFQYRASGMDLHSTAMTWYTIANHRAMFQGSATINGEGVYTFRVDATDGDRAGGQPDTFDIRIWEGTDPESAPLYHRSKNDLAGGSIVIHRN